MAQDYHIYIHSETSGNGGGNKTTPFSAKQDTPFSTKALNTVSKAKNMVNGGLVNTGVSALTKVLPVAAVVIAGAKIIDKILTIGAQHIEEYRGDYSRSINMENFHTAISHLVNPVGYFKRAIHRQFQLQKTNKQITEQNKLMGTTILKDMKVGI